MTSDNSPDANEPGLATFRLEKNAVNLEEARVFAHWLSLLHEQSLLYAVGGAFAVHAYTGILRNTKDLDIYIKPEDLKPALTAFQNAGYRTEVTDQTWLAKVHYKDYFMDLLFAMPRQRFSIRDNWFFRRRSACILDQEANLLGIEELFVSKVFMAKSYRFDGADILHLILKVRGRMNWQTILEYLGDEWELLLWYLLLFNFVYPGRSDCLPRQLMSQLFGKVEQSWQAPARRNKFRGTLLDPAAFEIDYQKWGYEDIGSDRNLVGEDGDAI